MPTTAILTNPTGQLSYPVRFVLPSKTSEGLREEHEAGQLSIKLKALPHKLNLAKANSDSLSNGHARWVLVQGGDYTKIATKAADLNKDLNGLLNSRWIPLSAKNPSWLEAWGHYQELRGVNSEIRELSDKVTELNLSLYDLIPEGRVWTVFRASCRALPGKSFDNTVEYESHKQTCRNLIRDSEEVALKEREVFDLLKRFKAGASELDKFRKLIDKAKESAVVAVNVLKDPGKK